MSESVGFEEAPGQLPSPGQIVARVGIASIGAANTVTSFEAGQVSLVDSIGYGPLAAATRRSLRHGKQKAVAALAAYDVFGTVSGVTKTGNGPTVTCVAIDESGAWFTFPNLKLTVSRAGALGEARASFSYDGITTHETVDLPPQLPASLIGSVDLTTITPSALDTLTFDLSSVDGANPAAITFSSVVTVAQIVAQVDAIAGLTASLVAGRYLKITAATLGETGVLTVANGTANTLLGFTNTQSADGVESTYDPPGVGARFTFAAGTYEVGTTYEVATVAPQMSILGFEAAAAALRASSEPFSILHVCHEPIDGVDLLAWQTALESFRVTCATAEDNPIFFKWILGGPMAPVEDWNALDQDVKTTLMGTQEANKFNTIVHGDVFLEWEEYSGRHRAQLAVPYVEECARNALNVNPGFGGKGALRSCYLKALNGNKARTEAEALIKMENFGYSVLRDDEGLPYIRAGRTRAPTTSQFTGEHTARAALECARIMRRVAFKLSNSTPDLAVSGQLKPSEKSSIENTFNDALKEGILKLGFASSAKAIIVGYTSIGGADKTFIKGVFQRKGWIKDIEITVYVTNNAAAVEGIA